MRSKIQQQKERHAASNKPALVRTPLYLFQVSKLQCSCVAMVLFSFACDIPHCGHRDINTSTEGMLCRGLNLLEIEVKRKATLV